MVNGDTVLEKNDRGKHLDRELLDEEWALFGVDADEASLNVLLANEVHVLVHDLAALEVSVEKGANHVISLSDGRQEFLLGNLGVGAMAHREVRTLNGVLFAGSFQAIERHLAHHALLIVIHCEIRILFLRNNIISGFLCLLNALNSESVNLRLCFCRLLGVDHSGLIGDGLLKDHIAK